MRLLCLTESCILERDPASYGIINCPFSTVFIFLFQRL